MSATLINSLNDFHQILKLHRIKEICLFIGNGPRLQYQDLDTVKINTSKAIKATLNIKLDQQKWLVLYGGDTFVKDNPDLGSVIHYVKNKYNPVLVSVQCWKEYDSHVDYVWKYPKTVVDNRIVYGGFDDEGKPVGGTSLYLCEEVRKLLTVVFNVDAQGRVGAKEKEFSLQQKLML